MVETVPGVSTASFVDDRFMVLQPAADFIVSSRLSAEFNYAFGFTCDVEKCRVGAPSSCAWADNVAHHFRYPRVVMFEVLGLTLDLDKESVGTLAGFSLVKVRRRLRLLSVVSACFRARRELIRPLCTPVFTWACAFGCISSADSYALRKDFLFRVGSSTARDKARPLCLEVLGYACDPVYCRRWSALQEFLRLRTSTREWQLSAPLSVSCLPLRCVLATVNQVLQELGWRLGPREDSIVRVDGWATPGPSSSDGMALKSSRNGWLTGTGGR